MITTSPRGQPCWQVGYSMRPGNNSRGFWESEFTCIMLLRIYLIFGFFKRHNFLHICHILAYDKFKLWHDEISRNNLTYLILFTVNSVIFKIWDKLNKHDSQHYHYSWQISENLSKSFCQPILFVGVGLPGSTTISRSV